MAARRGAWIDALISLAGGLMISAWAGSAARLSVDVLGTPQTDKWGAIFLHDAFHRAILSGRFPFVDPEQLVPVGAPLAAMNGDNVVEMAVSGLLRLVAPWPLWFNLAHLAWSPLLAAAFVPLGRSLWSGEGIQDRVFRAAAAWTWALSPVFFGELAAGRITQVVLLGLPLALAQLWGASEGALDRRGRTLGAVGIALTGLGYWFYAVFLAILAPVFVVRGAGRGRGVATFRELAILGAGAAVIVSPAIAGIAYSSHATGVSPEIPLPPGGLPPVFDNALQLARAQPVQLEGWFPWALAPGLGLALVATARRRSGAGPWIALAALSLAFGLGPGQYLGGRLWLLPYWPLWKAIPLLARLTHPSRWVDFGMLFLVVASFAGMFSLGRARLIALAVPLGLAAQLSAQGTLPLESFRFEVPKLWTTAAATPGALVVVPVMHAPDACRWQPFTRRPVLGGMAEGIPWAWPPAFRAHFEANPLLLQLLALGDGKVGAVDVREEDLASLRADGFTQIALDREGWLKWRHGQDGNVLTVLTAAFGAPIYAGPEGALWDLPATAASGSASPPAGVRLPPP